jgi:hypothetical protein
MTPNGISYKTIIHNKTLAEFMAAPAKKEALKEEDSEE